MKQEIGYGVVKHAILSCPDPEAQAIMAFQYALACRLGELFPYQHKPYRFLKRDKGKPFKEREHVKVARFDTQGLTYDSFIDKEDYWEVAVPNFKQRKNKRSLKMGIILKDSKEDWLANICLDWRESRKGKKEFWTIGPEAARKRLKKYLGCLGVDALAGKTFSSHNLRDSRANHLLKLFKRNILHVKDTLGHSNLATTNVYLNTTVEERASELKEALKKEE